MDVRGRLGRRLVVAAEAVNGNIVADDVFVAVNAELEEAACAGKTTCGCVLRVDDLSGGSRDAVSGSECKGRFKGSRGRACACEEVCDLHFGDEEGGN